MTERGLGKRRTIRQAESYIMAISATEPDGGGRRRFRIGAGVDVINAPLLESDTRFPQKTKQNKTLRWCLTRSSEERVWFSTNRQVGATS